MDSYLIALVQVFEAIDFSQKDIERLVPMFVQGVINKMVNSGSGIYDEFFKTLASNSKSTVDIVESLRKVTLDAQSQAEFKKAFREYFQEYLEAVVPEMTDEQNEKVSLILNNL